MIRAKDFAKSHNRNFRDIHSILKVNMENINSDGDNHVKLVNSEWLIDDFAATYLDALLIDSDNNKNQKDLQEIDEKSEIGEKSEDFSTLKKQISNLQNALQLAESKIKSKEEEFIALQLKVTTLSEGGASINSDLIRKYTQENDNLKKIVAQNKTDMDKLRKIKDARIESQENTIKELQRKIDELNTMLTNKMNSDMEILEKSMSVDSLNEKIHSLELDLADAEHDKEQNRFEIEKLESKNDDLRNLISSALSTLCRVQNSLRSGIEMPVIENRSNISDDNAAVFGDNSEIIEKRLEELRSLKAEGDAEDKKRRGVKFFFSKVASLF